MRAASAAAAEIAAISLQARVDERSCGKKLRCEFLRQLLCADQKSELRVRRGRLRSSELPPLNGLEVGHLQP